MSLTVAQRSEERTFKKIVAEHLAFRQSASQYGVHGMHVQEAFANEAPLRKQVLINLGRRCAVGVDAAAARKQPVKQGRRGGFRQRCGEPRLQNAEARHDAAAPRIHLRPVERVCGHPDQSAKGSRWQTGVTVECHHIGRARHRLRQQAQIHERRIASLGKPLDQIF